MSKEDLQKMHELVKQAIENSGGIENAEKEAEQMSNSILTNYWFWIIIFVSVVLLLLVVAYVAK